MKDPFTIERDKSIFNEEEISMFSDWGWFFLALATGLHKPESDRQKNFVKVNKGLIAPADEYQKLWFKYITRCELEKGTQTDWKKCYDDKLRSLIIKSHVRTIPPRSSQKPRNRSARNLNFPKNERSKSGKGDIPEGYRRRIDEGIGGSRDDWRKNRRRRDG